MVKYLYIDGVDDYASVPFTPSLNTDVFSVRVRVTPESTSNYGSVVSSRKNGSAYGYLLYKTNQHKWEFWLGKGGTVWQRIGNFTITYDQEYDIVCVFDGGTAYLYVNGNLNASSSVSGFQKHTGTDPFRIGSISESVNYLFKGKVYEVQYWQTALTSTDITNLFSGSNITSYAHYDMSTGTVNDMSGNGNHATLVGGTWMDDGTGGTTGTNVTVTSVTANASASTVAPTVTTQKQVSVSSVVAQASADGIAPSLSLGATVASVVGSAMADTVVPQVGSFANITVNAFVATTTASANNPSVEGIRNISVNAIVTNATASALVPNVGSTISTQITAVVASLVADAVVPAVSTSQGIQIASAVASVVVQGINPTLRTDAILSSIIANLQAAGIAPVVTLNAEVIIGTIQLKGSREVYVYLLGSRDLIVNLQGNRESIINLKGGVNVTVYNQNFVMESGDSKILNYAIGEELTGATLSWEMYRRGESTPFVTKVGNVVGNAVQVTLIPEDTATLKGTYAYELKSVDQQNYKSTLAKGVVTLE